MRHQQMARWAKRYWIEALLSNKYKPARGYLRMGGSDPKLLSFDPLGVLCEVIPQCSFQEARTLNEEDRYFCTVKRNEKDSWGIEQRVLKRDAQPVWGSYVPDTLAELVSLTPQAQYDLANWWDENKGLMFPDAARWIRKNL